MIPIVVEEIEKYARSHSTEVPALLNELERATQAEMELPQMLTGPLEGRFLKLLVQMTGAKRVIEVGMFTGYGTLSMAEGLPEEGRVITCELESKHIQFAKKFFERSPYGKKIDVREGPAAETLKTLKPPFDFVFIDADKSNYDLYYEESLRLLRPGGVIAVDNMLWSGAVLSPQDENSQALHALNKKIAKDSRVEAVLLTVRDGIQFVRKK